MPYVPVEHQAVYELIMNWPTIDLIDLEVLDDWVENRNVEILYNID